MNGCVNAARAIRGPRLLVLQSTAVMQTYISWSKQICSVIQQELQQPAGPVHTGVLEHIPLTRPRAQGLAHSEVEAVVRGLAIVLGHGLEVPRQCVTRDAHGSERHIPHSALVGIGDGGQKSPSAGNALVPVPAHTHIHRHGHTHDT
jgi:hypothetical protein